MTLVQVGVEADHPKEELGDIRLETVDVVDEYDHTGLDSLQMFLKLTFHLGKALFRSKMIAESRRRSADQLGNGDRRDKIAEQRPVGIQEFADLPSGFVSLSDCACKLFEEYPNEGLYVSKVPWIESDDTRLNRGKMSVGGIVRQTLFNEIEERRLAGSPGRVERDHY